MNLLRATQCRTCSHRIPEGHLFCKSCKRDRFFGIKQWESLVLLVLVGCVTIFGASGLAFIIPSAPAATRTPKLPPPQTSIPKPSRTPRPSATLRPQPSATEVIEQPPPTETGQYAKVSSQVVEVSLRKSPGYITKDDRTDVIVKIPSGQSVKIIKGPEKADGLNWWYVEWRQYQGWVAEKTGSGRLILIFNP